MRHRRLGYRAGQRPCIKRRVWELRQKTQQPPWRPVTVYQDFWATMYIANIFAALQYRTDAIISEKTEDSGNKYAQKTNETRLIKKFRDQFIECFPIKARKRSRKSSKRRWPCILKHLHKIVQQNGNITGNMI